MFLNTDDVEQYVLEEGVRLEVPCTITNKTNETLMFQFIYNGFQYYCTYDADDYQFTAALSPTVKVRKPTFEDIITELNVYNAEEKELQLRGYQLTQYLKKKTGLDATYAGVELFGDIYKAKFTIVNTTDCVYVYKFEDVYKLVLVHFEGNKAQVQSEHAFVFNLDTNAVKEVLSEQFYITKITERYGDDENMSFTRISENKFFVAGNLDDATSLAVEYKLMQGLNTGIKILTVDDDEVNKRVEMGDIFNLGELMGKARGLVRPQQQEQKETKEASSVISLDKEESPDSADNALDDFFGTSVTSEVTEPNDDLNSFFQSDNTSGNTTEANDTTVDGFFDDFGGDFDTSEDSTMSNSNEDDFSEDDFSEDGFSEDDYSADDNLDTTAVSDASISFANMSDDSEKNAFTDDHFEEMEETVSNSLDEDASISYNKTTVDISFVPNDEGTFGVSDTESSVISAENMNKIVNEKESNNNIEESNNNIENVIATVNNNISITTNNIKEQINSKNQDSNKVNLVNDNDAAYTVEVDNLCKEIDKDIAFTTKPPISNDEFYIVSVYEENEIIGLQFVDGVNLYSVTKETASQLGIPVKRIKNKVKVIEKHGLIMSELEQQRKKYALDIDDNKILCEKLVSKMFE